MKNTDNNANGKLNQPQNTEQNTQAKSVASDGPHPIHLAQLETNEHSSANAPATIVLAAVGDDLPVPLITQQSDNPPAPEQNSENQNQAEQAAAQSEATEQAQSENTDEAAQNVPGENTLLSQADLESLDESAAGTPVGDSMEAAVTNSFGNVDDVNDTRYDWDRPNPTDEFRYSFDQDFTPEIITAATTFNPVPIATDDFIGSVIRGSTCERDGSSKVEYDGKGKGCCGPTYNQLEFNILPNDIFSSDAPNVISSITFIQGGNPVTYNAAQFNGTLIHLDDGSSFTLHADGSLSYTGPTNVNDGELPGAPQTLKIFDYVLSDSTPDSDGASVYVKVYDPPVVQIGDACVVEGDQLVFPVTVYGELPPGFVLEIPYYTYEGSAQNGPDYTGTWGTLTFIGVEGQTSYTTSISVDTLKDNINECTENMYVQLDTNCTIINEWSYFNDTTGKGIIFDQPEKIPDQAIPNSGMYGEFLSIYEMGLPHGSEPNNDYINLHGNIFDNINIGSYNVNDISITALSLENLPFVLDTSIPGTWVLTSDHFVFTLDIEGTGKGDWHYELTNNINNPLPTGPEDYFNQYVTDLIKLTLQPLADTCGCGCNYEQGSEFSKPVGTALQTEGNEYGYYNNEECGCTPPTPDSFDVTLQIDVFDDSQIAVNDTYDVLVASCNIEGANNPQIGAPIIGNILANDTASADQIADGPNASNGMTVMYVIGENFTGPNPNGLLNPGVDNVFTSTSGATLVIRQDGSFEYTPPASGLTQSEVLNYYTVDGDGTMRWAEVTFKPDHAPVAVDDPAPANECATNEAWSIVITFNSSNAGYDNSFGYYIKDAHGNPTEGKIIWSNIHDTAVGASIELNQYVPPGVDPTDIGYFIIPNGGNLNNAPNDTDVTFFLDPQGHWQAQDGNTPLVGTDSNAYFDTGSLNKDNYPHVNNVGNGDFNWEDLYNGGDEDFNDVQVNIVNNFNDDNSGIVFGDLLANDCLSADGGNHISAIQFLGYTFEMGNNAFINITQDDVGGGPIPFVLIVNSNGTYTFDPQGNNTGTTQHLEFTYTLTDADGDSDTATFSFNVLDPNNESNCGCDDEIGYGRQSNDMLVAQNDFNSVSEVNLVSGSASNAAKLSVSGNILANDSTNGAVQIMNIAGQNVTNSDLASGFKIVSTNSGDIKVFLVDGSGHAQGDYVYTLTHASAEASDSISYSILSNNQLSSANILISIADDAPSAVSHDVVVWEQPIIAGQSGGMVVSAGNVLDGAKSGADVLPVSYAPKTAVDAISFEVLNLSNANQATYLALGAVISVLAGNISKVTLVVPLHGDISFGLPDGAHMTIGSDGDYSLKQPASGINADKSYAFSYEITDNDGSKAEADLNVSVKNFNGPIANEDNIWTVDSGTKNINVLDNDVLSGSATVREVTYKDEHNLSKTISIPQSGNGNNAWASFTTHSGAEVKIDKNGNVQYKPDNVSRGQSEMDVMSYKVVESGNNGHSSVGEIKAHVYDKNADFEHLNGDNRNNTLDATDLSGTVVMTGNGGKNEFKIDLGNASRSNENPSDVIITDLFKSGTTNSLTFTHVSDSDGKVGLGIGDIISSINTVSQVSPNGDIHVSFNNGTNLSIQDPGFTMSMPTANEFIQQLQEHSIQVSTQN